MSSIASKVEQKVLQDDNYAIACALTLCNKPESVTEEDMAALQELTTIYRNRQPIPPRVMKRARIKITRYTELIMGPVSAKPAATKSRASSGKKGKDAFWLSNTHMRLDFKQTRKLAEVVKYMGKCSRIRWGGSLYWRVGLSIKNVVILLDNGFTLEPAIREWYDSEIEKLKVLKEQTPPAITTDEIGLNLALRPFQEEGVGFLHDRGGRAILADDMGLGKTCQAIAYAKYSGVKRVLVVCPASVKHGWESEFMKWTNTRSDVLSGRKPMLLDSSMTHLVINYDIIQNWTETLVDFSPDLLIIDECHKIKNRDTKRYEAVEAIAERCPHIIPISGTPIKSRPDEFFSVLKMLDPKNFSNHGEYSQAYCGAVPGYYGWEYEDPKNLDQLNLEVSRYMIRRLKKDVLHDLPEKQRTIISIDYDKALYQKALQKFEEFVDSAESTSSVAGFAAVEVMKQACLDAKLDNCINWTDDFLESGEKLVIFTTHVRTIKALKKHYGDKLVFIDGSVPTDKRKGIVEQFRTDDSIRVFAGNIAATGEGLDGLQGACSNAVFFELAWTPGEHDQTEDRIHRIGQKDGVVIWYLIAQGTIESDIWGLINKKREVLAQVVDGKAASGKNDMLSDLLKKYRRAA